ncbi:hypothetical protein PUN28_017880 [Cardiocondyla obscurior]|uniref:DUF4806 domain-containing protein n=1 Tax=Cardiocondyla obscurior TaxID=286306 RepID=A0AAW2EJE0_9HYME
MDKETKWLIVKFNKENKVDVVPAKWYIHDIKKCYWPPKKISHKTSDDRLTSNDETFKKKKNRSRKKILKKASVPKSSSSSSDITSISVESDINTYPTEINMEGNYNI